MFLNYLNPLTLLMNITDFPEFKRTPLSSLNTNTPYGSDHTPPIIISPPPPRATSNKRKRNYYTDYERRAIRQYKRNPENSDPPLKQIRIWFEHEYYKKIFNSTFSETLSIKYQDLDTEKPKKADKYQKQRRHAENPDLESALNEWQITIIRKGSSVTGDLLKEIAGRL